jgi:hypothetical protein
MVRGDEVSYNGCCFNEERHLPERLREWSSLGNTTAIRHESL